VGGQTPTPSDDQCERNPKCGTAGEKAAAAAVVFVGNDRDEGDDGGMGDGSPSMTDGEAMGVTTSPAGESQDQRGPCAEANLPVGIQPREDEGEEGGWGEEVEGEDDVEDEDDEEMEWECRGRELEEEAEAHEANETQTPMGQDGADDARLSGGGEQDGGAVEYGEEVSAQFPYDLEPAADEEADGRTRGEKGEEALKGYEESDEGGLFDPTVSVLDAFAQNAGVRISSDCQRSQNGTEVSPARSRAL
jgi:hypothetical protein